MVYKLGGIIMAINKLKYFISMVKDMVNTLNGMKMVRKVLNQFTKTPSRLGNLFFGMRMEIKKMK